MKKRDYELQKVSKIGQVIHDVYKYLVDTIDFNSSNSTKNKLEITWYFKK